jgi:ABC-2 type transport system ATP-binding protein
VAVSQDGGKASHTASKVVLKCTKLSKKINTRKVIHDFSLTIHRGEVVAVLSPEGGGKTTLAKMICGLIPPGSGAVTIRGKKAGQRTNALVSYLPEIPYIKYDSTIVDMLTLYNRFFSDFKYKKAYRLLKEFKINPKTRFDDLSTTAIQLVETILVASRRTSLYVFDEPLVNVDNKYRDGIIKIIASCRKYGGIIILSQYAGSGLDSVLDRVIFLQRGEVLLNGRKGEVEEKYGMSVSTIYREVFR